MREPHEGTFLTDLIEFGPAPTMGRELVVIVLNVAVLAVLFAIVGPTPVVWIAIAVVGVAMGVRFLVGLRGWNRAASKR